MRRLSLMLITEELSGGERDRQLVDLAGSLDPERFRVLVTTVRDGAPFADDLRSLGAAELRSLCLRGPLEPMAVLRLAALLRREHVDVVQSTGWSTLGLAMNPNTGAIWENENGPNGGDEINVLKPGANYGWPLVSLGRTYPGPWQSKGFSKEGYEDPIVYWTPAIAVSGMAFYTGSKLAKWKGDVFVGSMRVGEIPGTGHFERILFNENMEELRRESLLVDWHQRIRDVRQGPDELLYLLTDDDNGVIIRIEPAS